MNNEETWTMTVNVSKEDFKRMNEDKRTDVAFCNYYRIPDDSVLTFHVDDLKKRVNKSSAKKVRMQGLVSDLLNIKKDIEDACIFAWDAQWSASEAGYFGWEGKIYEQQVKLCDTIMDNILNVYADVLVGLYGAKEV